MGNPCAVCGTSLDAHQMNGMKGSDSGPSLLKALLFLGVLMLTLRPEYASFPNYFQDIHSNSFLPPKDYLTLLMKIFAAQWTTHSRGFLSPFQPTVGTFLTLSSQNTVTCAHFPMPAETVTGGKVPHLCQTVFKAISQTIKSVSL